MKVTSLPVIGLVLFQLLAPHPLPAADPRPTPGAGAQAGIPPDDGSPSAVVVSRQGKCDDSLDGPTFTPLTSQDVVTLSGCLKTRPVRVPGLQATGFSPKSCRPRALTRRGSGVLRHALRPQWDNTPRIPSSVRRTTIRGSPIGSFMAFPRPEPPSSNVHSLRPVGFHRIAGRAIGHTLLP